MEDEFAYLRHAHITDFEQINALSRTTETTIVQLDNGPFESDIVKFKAGGVLVSRTTSNRRLRVSGVAKYFNVTYVDCPRSQGTWNGTAVGKNQLLVVGANETFDLVVPPGTTTICVAFDAKALDRLLDLSHESTRDRIHVGTSSISCQPAALAKFDHWLSQTLDRLTKTGCISKEARGLEQSVVEELRRCIDSPIESEWGKEPTELRRQAVDKIQDFIEKNNSAPGSIEQLCEIGEVSRRTLEYAFKEIFGCSPRQFLKGQRLNSARMALLRANQQDNTVASIANAQGFSHMSQFSSDYQKRFGEQPRQTLARVGSTSELKELFSKYES